ncbi:DUF1292 domain-containing protein [Sediminibacillus massiliensis]|uniref:DUF1292 domain-containing protein n=1 Tax=Sediminibacillus massiliensis TaxID=1926277 RepID=UPI0009885727|nr:DUF1292 domain-containing protein [Sediminibacillus massiliensis]
MQPNQPETNNSEKDYENLIIEDEAGNEELYDVDAVIEMDNKEYVLYSSGENMKMKRILHEDDEEFLLDVSEEEMDKLMNAYEEALAEDIDETH